MVLREHNEKLHYGAGYQVYRKNPLILFGLLLKKNPEIVLRLIIRFFVCFNIIEVE